MNETERGYEAQRNGNQAVAEQRFKNAGDASKLIIFEGVGIAAAKGVGKLIRVGEKLKLRVYRYERTDRVATTWEVNQFNIEANHRYTFPGSGGVYSSLEPETALLEISYQGSQNGRVLVQRDFAFNKVLDLTKTSVRKKLGISLKDITSDSYDVTHKLGSYAKENGFEAILAPSARNNGGTNVIILNE